ncbi:L-histidine N(alpha)-methyltransferase [Guptibacillus hwajinpoensis]|uniref:Dimethylhistidine N-methyltransferase n=1 Tax=Guptibacillus hwajinpoensis TaxID=208199 RepID=A0ABU0K4T2_9BACL|nr:L-histidine N(alpha)-methyltransferase [Alkalihalobacillus hemicentroti]MDQ0483132.1 dimethylhistidine N-methyltransferase [Alkalihalobacillus hemicentroti]
MIKTLSNMRIIDQLQEQNNRFDEAIESLTATKKSLQPKFLYDKYGSILFEQITQLEEYYPTRTELSIMERSLDEILRYIGSGSTVIEFGSGASRKIRMLLESGTIHEYIPIDISKSFLMESSEQLSIDYPAIQVTGIVADYTNELNLPKELMDAAKKKTVFFPGSTIGNFEKKEAHNFLSMIAALLSSGDGLLIGVDVKKAPRILHNAYNDKEGITAKFNLNLLTHLNRELGADFNLNQFEHYAFYNAELGRVEMHLVSMEEQVVTIGNESILFNNHETIHTENSYKYSISEFQQLASGAGFVLEKTWTDPKELFSLHYLSVL